MQTALSQIESTLFLNAGLAAAGAAAVALPIAIHLLTRFRRRPEPWAAMRFLVQAFRKQRRRMRMEQWLLLLLRCAIVLLLGAALAGPLLGGILRKLGVQPASRLVLVIIDDSLTTQVREGAEQVRFESLRAEAMAVVDSLQPGDRIGVYRAARPASVVVSPDPGEASGQSIAVVRQAIESLKPQFSGSDLDGALNLAASAIATFGNAQTDAAAVVISDFAFDSVDLTRDPPGGWAAVSRQAEIHITRPRPQAGNVQVSSLRPRRWMILPRGVGTPTAPVELRLRRFASGVAGELVEAEVTLADVHGRGSTSVARPRHRWAAGQREAVINLELPLPADDPATSGVAGGGSRMLALKVQLDPGSTPDALEADNFAWGVVELRQRLNAALIDDDAGVTDGGLRPEQWLRFALAPRGGRELRLDEAPEPVQFVSIRPGNVGRESLATVDVAMVLRPDAVGAAGWAGLKDMLSRGGLVWVFAPVVEGDAGWPQRMIDGLGLPDGFALTPGISETDAESEDGGATMMADEGVRLKLDAAAPGLLSLLSADWQALLAPVRVYRHLSLRWPAGDATRTWVSLDHVGGDEPLLVARPMEPGLLVLMTAALDPAWTNLPAKPLFVPLLQETLRGALGESAANQPEAGLVAGMQPTLGEAWRGVEALASIDGMERLTVAGDRKLEQPLRTPGMYQAEPAVEQRLLAVNIDPHAADTRAVDSDVLSDWMNALGSWQWFDAGAFGADPKGTTSSANIGWSLLWLLLVLVLAEALLARWFSHAGVNRTASATDDITMDAASAGGRR